MRKRWFIDYRAIDPNCSLSGGLDHAGDRRFDRLGVWHVDVHISRSYNFKTKRDGVVKVQTQENVMAGTSRSEARINVRLPGELKQTIEEAAVELGQSITEFTVATIVREARHVLENSRVTRLSNRDRDAFLAALDDADARPNEALKAAARRYKKRVR